MAVETPKIEFSRVINIEQIPERRPVLCKLLAKENERSALAIRFDIPKIEYFGANVTISRQSSSSILVEGKFDARVRFGELLDIESIVGEFDTVLLNNFGVEKGTYSFSLLSRLPVTY